MDDHEKEIKKIERKIFKLECKLESIDDELYHLEGIRVDHGGKLNKKRKYRKEHLLKVKDYYKKEIGDMSLEINKLRKEMREDL